MQVPDIKQQLTIGQVLDHYGLQPNKNKMLLPLPCRQNPKHAGLPRYQHRVLLLVKL